MATLKIKNEHGTWDDIPALRGRDGAIQYTAGANIEISSDNVISARGLENTVTRDDVTEMINEAVPTDVSDLTNDAGYVTSADIPTDVSDLNNDAGYATTSDIPTKTSDLINDGMGDHRGLYGYAAVFPRDTQYPWGISIEGNGSAQRPWLIKPIVADMIVNKPLAFKDDLPTKLSDLTNDAGFVTSAAVPTKTSDLINDAGFVPITNVPNNLSDLNNDVGYITLAEAPTSLVVAGTGGSSRILTANETDNRANINIFSKGSCSTAEGYNTVAGGTGAHAEGINNTFSVSSVYRAGTEIRITGAMNVPNSVDVGSKIYCPEGDYIATILTANRYTGSYGITLVDLTFEAPLDVNVGFTFYPVNAASQGTHSEGATSLAVSPYSHAEGLYNQSLGRASHSEGYNTKATGDQSHTGGSRVKASGENSLAHGINLINEIDNATLLGQNGDLDATNDAETLFAVANGSDSSNKNIGMKLVGLNGNGKLYVEGTLMGADPTTYTGYDATKTQVLKNIQGVLTWVDEV